MLTREIGPPRPLLAAAGTLRTIVGFKVAAAALAPAPAPAEAFAQPLARRPRARPGPARGCCWPAQNVGPREIRGLGVAPSPKSPRLRQATCAPWTCPQHCWCMRNVDKKRTWEAATAVRLTTRAVVFASECLLARLVWGRFPLRPRSLAAPAQPQKSQRDIWRHARSEQSCRTSSKRAFMVCSTASMRRDNLATSSSSFACFLPPLLPSRWTLPSFSFSSG